MSIKPFAYSFSDQPMLSGMNAPTQSQPVAAVTDFGQDAIQSMMAELKTHPPEVGQKFIQQIQDRGLSGQQDIALALKGYLTAQAVPTTEAPTINQAAAPAVETRVAIGDPGIVFGRKDWRGEVSDTSRQDRELFGRDIPRGGPYPCQDLCPPDRNTAFIAEMGQFRPQAGLPNGRQTSIGQGRNA